MSARIYPSLRESIHGTATSFPDGMKKLASEIDYSPSELSMRTTLGGDSARPFPADDEHLLKLIRVTGDHSFLFTLCALLGYEPPTPKRDRLPEMIERMTGSAQALTKELQQLMLFAAEQMGDPKRGRR